MAENVVFERFVSTPGRDSLYVRLESSVDNGLTGITPVSVDMAEGLSYPSPMVSITFIDMVGDLFNTTKIDPNAEYHLYVGRDLDELVDCRMKVSKVKFHNQSLSKSQEIVFTIHFTYVGWYEMVAKKYNRSWSESKISDVIEEITEECDFEEIDVSQTNTVYERLIQPHWSNTVFINWLRQMEESDPYGHIEYGTTLRGRFICKSLAKMINEQASKAFSGKLPVLKLQGEYDEDRDRVDSKKKNNETVVYFVRFDVTDHYMNSIMNGSGGMRSIWYDTENDELHDEEIKYSESNSSQLTEFGPIKTNHESVNNVHIGGRDSYSDQRSMHKVSNAINSTIPFDVTLESSPEISIGDMVELVIPTPHTNAQDPFNIIYSGFYIVGAVSHSAEFKRNTFMSKLTLIRAGYDSPDLEGYVTSSQGRFV